MLELLDDACAVKVTKVLIKFLYRTVGRKGENTAIAAVSGIRRRTPRPRS